MGTTVVRNFVKRPLKTCRRPHYDKKNARQRRDKPVGCLEWTTLVTVTFSNLISVDDHRPPDENCHVLKIHGTERRQTEGGNAV